MGTEISMQLGKETSDEQMDLCCSLCRTRISSGLTQRTRAHGRTHAGAGKNCEKEGVGEKRICSGLTTVPIPHSPCAAQGKKGGRGVGYEEGTLNLGRRSREERCFSFSPSYSIFMGSNLK